MSAESRKKTKRAKKKEKKKQKMQCWKRRLINWISGLMHRLFGSSTQKALTCEAAKFYSENHAHIVCEHAKHKFVPILTFLAGKEVLKSYDVPGKEMQNRINVAEEVLTRFISGAFIRLELLHSEGKTLKGCFSAESVRVPKEDLFSTPHLDVRFSSIPLEAFQPYTEEGGDLDLKRFGSILENNILSSEKELPPDLIQLLDLLKSDPVSKKTLIHSHISLKGLKGKISYFTWMYKRLLYLKKKHHNKYKKIMEKISVCDKDDKEHKDWRYRAKRNKYLAGLRPVARYSKKGEGKSRFYRNSVEHLLLKLFGESNTILVQNPLANGPQPASQQNGAIEEAQSTGFQLASHQTTAQNIGAQQSESQPASQRKEVQPTTHKKGAQQDDEAQVEEDDDEEDKEEDDDEKDKEDDEEEEEEEGLEEYHIAIVLLEAFPKFLGDLQEAIHDENELESCNVEGPIKRGKNNIPMLLQTPSGIIND